MGDAVGSWAAWASIIRSCCLTSKTPLTPWEINRDTKMLEGRDIPYKKFRYSTLEEMLRKINGLTVFLQQGKIVVKVTPTEETAHISRMVGLQKPAKQKLQKRPSGDYNKFSANARRPPSDRSQPNNQNVPQYNNAQNGLLNQRPTPKRVRRQTMGLTLSTPSIKAPTACTPAIGLQKSAKEKPPKRPSAAFNKFAANVRRPPNNQNVAQYNNAQNEMLNQRPTPKRVKKQTMGSTLSTPAIKAPTATPAIGLQKSAKEKPHKCPPADRQFSANERCQNVLEYNNGQNGMPNQSSIAKSVNKPAMVQTPFTPVYSPSTTPPWALQFQPPSLQYDQVLPINGYFYMDFIPYTYCLPGNTVPPIAQPPDNLYTTTTGNISPQIHLDEIAKPAYITHVCKKYIIVQLSSNDTKQLNTLVTEWVKKDLPGLRFDLSEMHVTKNVNDVKGYELRITKVENVGNILTVIRNNVALVWPYFFLILLVWLMYKQFS